MSKELVEERGAGAVYTEHLSRIARPWTERGYRVQMWADVLEHHPEDARRLPEGMAPVVWLYESPASLAAAHEARAAAEATAGTSPAEDPPADGDVDRPDGFARRLSGLASRGKRPWVAPGTGAWDSIGGRVDNCWENVQDAARSLVALADGGSEGRPAVSEEGMILTHWGDHGSWEPYVLLVVPLAYASVLARGPEVATREQAHELAATVIGADAVQSVLDLGRLDAVLPMPQLYGVLLGRHALAREPRAPRPEPEQAARARELIARVRDRHPDPSQSYVADLLHVADVAEAVLDSFEGPLPTRVCERIIEAQRASWLRTSRPGGLDDSIAHMVVFAAAQD